MPAEGRVRVRTATLAMSLLGLSASLMAADAQQYSCPAGTRLVPRGFCAGNDRCPPPLCVPVEPAPRAPAPNVNPGGYAASPYRHRVLPDDSSPPVGSAGGNRAYHRDPANPWRADCLRQNPDNDPLLDDVEACRQADLWDNGPRPQAAPPVRPPSWSGSTDTADAAPEPDDPPEASNWLTTLSAKLTAAGANVVVIAKCLRSPARAARCMFVAAGIPPDDGLACFSSPWPAPCMDGLITQYGKAADRILADQPKW
jgi:hypothetical protein